MRKPGATNQFVPKAVRPLAIAAVFLSAAAEHRPQSTVNGGESAASAIRTTSEERAGGYVGSAACVSCHAGIAKSFAKTAMGRSMTAVSPSVIEKMKLPDSLDNSGMDRHFEVYAKDGRLFEAESQRGTDGKVIFNDFHNVPWIIGAGENGFGVLVKRENYLFQGPLSYYSRAGHWGLSPGYEFGDYGFSRPILAGCIGCHSGRPRPVPATNGRYEEPAFSQLEIGCENCHGPGSAHIAAMRLQKPAPDDHSGIVNPARLDARLANDICMSCHEMGDVRVFRPGKSYADFRPGKPLNDILDILLVAPTRDSPPDADHLQHYFSMTLSKCYRASGAMLTCITCHDPHVEPTSDEAPAYFAKKCMSCHNEQSCRAPISVRESTHPADNCAGCHMPKRDVQTIQHASVTNHRIVATPDEPFPDVTFEHASGSPPGLIQLASRNESAPALSLLRGYGELLDAKPEYANRYAAVLDELEKSEPGSALVQSALARRDLKRGAFESAISHMQKAIEIGPAQAVMYGDEAEANQKLGRLEEALNLQKKAVELDPFNPVLQKNEIVLLISLKQYNEARGALEHYLEVFPQDSFMRKMLEMANKGATAK